MAERVRITDVSPRDGLQNEPGVIPTAEKVRLIELLCATGVDEIEVTSFVSPKWVPQLGDAKELLELLGQNSHGRGCPSPQIRSALVPNERGMQSVIDVNRRASCRLVDKVSVFTAASETFNRKNINASIAESIERFRPVILAAHAEEMPVRAYISCAIACPFEGPIKPEAVVAVMNQLLDLDVDEIDLGDTIGAATVATTSQLLEAVDSEWPLDNEVAPVTMHFHDTFGRAADCVKAALDCGVMSFDGSVAGLGGCPYASTPGHRAPGNISTETLVRTIHGAGYETGVDLDKLDIAAQYAREIVTKSRNAAAAKGRTEP